MTDHQHDIVDWLNGLAEWSKGRAWGFDGSPGGRHAEAAAEIARLRAEPTERELSTFEYDCRRWDSTRALRNFVASRAAHTAENHQEKDRA